MKHEVVSNLLTYLHPVSQ